jgi:3-phenylpropionate/trans-cinnamate dioxygenase ferredoxin reductase subunit
MKRKTDPGRTVLRKGGENRLGDRLFPSPLAQFVSNYYKQKRVELLAGEKIIGLERRGNQRVLKTGTNREIAVDGVMAGVGNDQ